MGDLMEDTYTYSELANQYGNFIVPSVKILVNGNDTSSSKNVAVTNINIILSIENAGCVTFNIEGAYDRKNRRFNPEVKSGYSLGKVVEAEIGYMSERIKVFKGFITGLAVEFNDNPSLKITAMDVRKLMMDSGRRVKNYEKPNYTDIVSEIMTDYENLCSLTIDSTDDGLTESMKQEESDYSFIQKLAGITNREFFVIGDKGYFRTPKKNKSALITLEYGFSLLSFRRQSRYLHSEIVTCSYDKSEQDFINSSMEAKNDDKQEEVLSSPQKIILIEEDAETADELKTRAESYVRKMKDRANEAGGKCIGMPCLIPGRFIELTKLDDEYDHKYYISEVRHNISNDGFTTEFEAKGWED